MRVSIGALSLVALTHFATAIEQCLSLTSGIPTCAVWPPPLKTLLTKDDMTDAL